MPKVKTTSELESHLLQYLRTLIERQESEIRSLRQSVESLRKAVVLLSRRLETLMREAGISPN